MWKCAVCTDVRLQAEIERVQVQPVECTAQARSTVAAGAC